MKRSSSRAARSLPEILALLEGLREEARRRYRAEIVGIFGSYARGEARKRSDLDVLVRFLEGASLFDLVGLADFLEEHLGLRVDVVSERAIRPELRDRILREVVRL
ncbi:MAG TPA: nucleotidyltransferase family protein [Chthonomonadales bacterium]|nr:nucleotidyltransferase family protein [Chthonomonadales bacterium]